MQSRVRSAGRDADEHELGGVLGAERRLLDDLVRDARDGAGDVGGAQQLPVGSAGPRVPATRIAEERYARGEISAAELERVRSDLQAAE